MWIERASRGAAGEDQVTYVAEDGDRWLGMATGLVDNVDASRIDLVGMFVEPAARGQGIGALLVDAVVGWARARGSARLYLWVTTTNRAALALYQRSGFRPTGDQKPLDHTPSVSEIQMVRDL